MVGSLLGKIKGFRNLMKDPYRWQEPFVETYRRQEFFVDTKAAFPKKFSLILDFFHRGGGGVWR